MQKNGYINDDEWNCLTLLIYKPEYPNIVHYKVYSPVNKGSVMLNELAKICETSNSLRTEFEGEIQKPG